MCLIVLVAGSLTAFVTAIGFWCERLMTDALPGETAGRDQLAPARAAMHPHFLFNTMNAICGYAVNRDHETVIAMLTRLSDLLRVGYRRGDSKMITLLDEVHSLQSYLELQQLRYGVPVSVEVALESGAGGALVAPLTLQALLDEAIAGSAAQFTNGTVRVRATCGADAIEVEVAGNCTPRYASHGDTINAEGSMLRLHVLGPQGRESALERTQ